MIKRPKTMYFVANGLELPVAPANYKETELWKQAKNLLIETYRLTQGWPEEGKELAAEIRFHVRRLVSSVPDALKKPGLHGNYSLTMAGQQFVELEALCEVAEALGFVEQGKLQPLLELAEPIEAEFKALGKAARAHARELRQKQQAQMYGGGLDEEDEEF